MKEPLRNITGCVLTILFVLGSVNAVFYTMPNCPNIYEETYDYVIIGTGPASGPLIRRLTDAGYSVVVLEKGTYFYQQDTEGNQASKPDTNTDPVFGDDFQVYESVYEYPSFNYSQMPPPKRNAVPERPLNEVLGLRPDFMERIGLSGRSLNDQGNDASVLQRMRAYPYAQVQGFGGQTLTYGGLNIRPSPHAFDSWPAGFSYEKMLPFYKMMEQFSFACDRSDPGMPDPNLAHNCNNPSGFISVNVQRENEYPPLVNQMPNYCASGSVRGLWKNTCNSTDAVDYNGDYPNRAFCGPPQFSGIVQQEPNGSVFLTRNTLQKTYLPYSYVENSSSLQVCLKANVRRLIVDSNGFITGAQVAGSEKVVRGKRYILVSGVRYTPAILMSSGIGDPAVLSKYEITPTINLPGVGTNFHDEWAYALSFTVVNNTSYWIPKNKSVVNRNQMHIVKFISSAQNNFTDVQLYLRLDNELSLDLYLPTSDSGSVSFGNSFAIRVALFQIDTFGNNSGIQPTSSNGFYVDRFTFNVDMFANLNLLQRFLTGAWAGFAEAMRVVDTLIQERDPNGNYLTLVPTPVTETLILAANSGVDAFEKVLSDQGMVLALHGGGTCGIGRCVDSDFKVIGTNNLYVCDMSIFPTPVDANPTATLFALGERLAQELINNHLDSSNSVRLNSFLSLLRNTHPGIIE